MCLKITFNHINPSKMLRMRVKLATQIFCNSVAKGILFYAKRGASRLTNVEPTVEFTLFLNDLFAALNRRFPAEGLKLDGKDFLCFRICIRVAGLVGATGRERGNS